MSVAELTLKSLHLMSPGMATDFGEKLTAAVLDCRQRPSLPASRQVVIKLTIKPHPEDPDDVTIHPEVTSSTPTRKLEPLRARRTRKNQLQFDFSEEDL